jgi:hypothetical protein
MKGADSPLCSMSELVSIDVFNNIRLFVVNDLIATRFAKWNSITTTTFVLKP